MRPFTSKTTWIVVALAVVWAIGQAPDDGTSRPDAASRVAPSAPSGFPSDTDVPVPLPDPTGPSKASPSPTRSTGSSPSPRPTASSQPAGTALVALAALRVKGRAPMTGYARERFGQAWLDADRNGCDTRNDLLRRDLTGLTLKPGTHDCVVLSGTLADPYTGTRIAFVRGDGDDVDIDHVVALGNAWVTGAARWDIHRRAALANDPLELLAVDASANRQKGDGDAATWLPANKAFRCDYAARMVAIKKKYSLWVTPPERDALRRVLSSCPGKALTLDRWHHRLRVDQDITDPGPPNSGTGAAGGTPQPQPLAGGTTYYKNCDAVRAAGAAPLHRGDPGYDRHLDRDGDGVACE